MFRRPLLLPLVAAALGCVSHATAQLEWRRTLRPGCGYPCSVVHDSNRDRVVVVQPTATRLEVFEWDGRAWHRPRPPVSPPARSGAAIAYDPTRKRTVIFGGSWWSTGELADTWEWDGQMWHEQTPAARPSRREGAQATFAPSLNEVVIYGGHAKGVLRGDLWSWDGKRWQLRDAGKSTNAPLPRNLHTIFYDSRVGELVLFGGFVGNNRFIDDTWSWRPNQGWRQLATSGRPSPRGWHQVAFDSKRGVGVLFGQYLLWNNEETWEWHGPQRRWVQVTRQPPGGLGREGAAVFFDGRSVLLFGGNAHHRSAKLHGARSDLFEWNPQRSSWIRQQGSMPPGGRWLMATDSKRGVLVAFRADHAEQPVWERAAGNWRSFAPATRPVARWHPGLADTGRGSVLLFGGHNNATGALGDTWRFDGRSWTALANGPSARSQFGMTGTPWNGGTVFLFGGLVGEKPDVASDELWAHNGTAWTKVTKTLLWPPALIGAALVHDTARNRLVLFGGRLANGQSSRQTWEWDGTRWHIINPIRLAPAMVNHRMAYDPRLRASVAMNWTGEGWTYDGRTWTKLGVCELPGVGSHHGAGLGFDPGSSELVLLGAEGGEFLGEWTLSTSNRARFETFGVGCPAVPSEPSLAATGKPVLGSVFDLDVRWPRLEAAALYVGSSRTQFAGGTLPFDLSALGFAGCWLQVATDFLLAPSSLRPRVSARFRIPLPNDGAFVGVCLFAQSIVPSRTDVGFSDAALLRLGR